MNDTPTPCWIFRSPRKSEMYLYLDREDGFADLPEGLRRLFGPPTLVMRLELHPGRPLAQEDVRQVIQNLRARGYHLQMPPVLDPTRLHS